MCRGLTTARSRNTVASPNAACASRMAAATDSRSCPGSSTRRIPRPPPPATALTNSGKPSSSDAATSSSISADGADDPSTGRPASRAAAMARDLSPVRCSTSGGGPTNVMPASAQACARSGFSDRNPYPG